MYRYSYTPNVAKKSSPTGASFLLLVVRGTGVLLAELALGGRGGLALIDPLVVNSFKRSLLLFKLVEDLPLGMSAILKL